MTRIYRMTALLEQELSPTELVIRDDSPKHANHYAASEEGETHLHITIASPKFQGLTRVAQHRAVMALLQPEMDKGLHALSLDTRIA